jgi:hypothetical protein
MSMFTGFIFKIFKGANKITTKSNLKSTLYEQQINFYNILKEDLASAFITKNTQFFTDQISSIIGGNNRLTDFTGDKTELNFYIKKDTGLHKITYKINKNELTKITDLGNKITEEQPLIHNTSPYEFISLDSADTKFSYLPDKIITKITLNCQNNKKLTFKHIFNLTKKS